MKSVALKAFPRTATRRCGIKKLRENGRVPAVIYGQSIQPQNLEFKAKEIEDLIDKAASENTLLDLEIPSDARPKRLAILQDIQHHPVTGRVLHVDLHEIKEDEKVTINVAVEPVGEAVGVKTGGGVLEHVMFKMRVRGLAKDLPEVIHVDVTDLDLGKAIHVGQIKVPEGVEVVGNKELTVLAVALPKTEEQEKAETEAAAGTADVEMIREKKEGEEGEEAKPGEKAAAPAAAAPAAGAKPAAGDKAKPAGDKKK